MKLRLRPGTGLARRETGPEPPRVSAVYRWESMLGMLAKVMGTPALAAAFFILLAVNSLKAPNRLSERFVPTRGEYIKPAFFQTEDFQGVFQRRLRLLALSLEFPKPLDTLFQWPSPKAVSPMFPPTCQRNEGRLLVPWQRETGLLHNAASGC